MEPGSSNGATVTAPVSRQTIMELIKYRDSIDDQIQALGTILSSNHIDMTQPLVDAEGFPRNDIDVYQVRHARQKIICLQNDYKTVTKDIEAKISLYFEHARENGLTVDELGLNQGQQPSCHDVNQIQAIAMVNLVSEGSPAFHAGVKVDDQILSVGSINSDNFSSLQDIGTLVQACQGSVVNVKVRRNHRLVNIALIPGPWSGRGLIGCNIVPINDSQANPPER